MTFETNVVPDGNNTRQLGSTTAKWVLNGLQTGDAIAKNVDSSVTSQGTGLPTSAAVASYVGSQLTAITTSQIDALFAST